MTNSAGLGMSWQVRRFAALGLLIVVLTALSGWLVRPLLQWAHESTEELADARFSLARAHTVAQIDRTLSVPEIEQAERELLPWLLNGATETEASASLQSMVDGVLRSEGLMVESAQAVPTAAAGAISSIRFDWRGTGSEPAVMRALAALERNRPLVRIERLVLRSNDAGMTGPQQAPLVRMNVEMRLTGFWVETISASTQSAGVKR